MNGINARKAISHMQECVAVINHHRLQLIELGFSEKEADEIVKHFVIDAIDKSEEE
jgi:peptidyl-tRNA hydrolase